MGILDGLRHKVGELGEKAREGLEEARDKAGDLLDDARDRAGDVVDDVRDRLGQDEEHDGDRAPTGESEDVGPDSSSTDAVQPGYVTGEDVDGVDTAEEVDGADEPVPGPDAVDAVVDEGTATGTGDAPLDPVAKDVDPYEEPLSESIGAELSDAAREALAGVVDGGTDKDA